MKTHYYFSWFNSGFPDRIAKKLKNDLVGIKSIVLISGNPNSYFESDLLIKTWFDQADIIFDDYHIINKETTRKEAKDLLEKASVIFLCGGYPILQHQFLNEYELVNVINNSPAIIMGASAGAMNMSSKWLNSVNTNQEVDSSSIIDGLALDNFYFCTKANQSIADKKLLNELLPLSNKLKIYMAIDEVAIRMKNSQLDIFGEVYLLENEIIKKMKVTF